MRTCGAVYEEDGVVVSCEEPYGHRGAHKGFSLCRQFGAWWRQ